MVNNDTSDADMCKLKYIYICNDIYLYNKFLTPSIEIRDFAQRIPEKVINKATDGLVKMGYTWHQDGKNPASFHKSC